jgi:HEAT repeat protein
MDAKDEPALERMAPEAREKALVEILGRPSLPVRARALAAHGLGRSDAPSAAALEALTRALGDEEDEVARAARTTLWQILPLAPAGVPGIIEVLGNGSPAARRNAVHVLRHLHWGPEPPGEANQVAPALALALDDPDASVRREAADALCRSPWLSRAEAAGPPSSGSPRTPMSRCGRRP